MSSEATTWALAQKTGSASAKAALLALAGYADEHGRCWPSLQRLADNSEQSRKTIWRQLRHLEAIGLIEIFTRARDNGSNTTCEYQLKGFSSAAVLAALRRAPALGSGRGHSDHAKHGQNDTGPVSLVTPPETSLEVEITPLAPKGAVGAESWKGWEQDPAYLAFLAEYAPSQAWPKHRGHRQWLKLTADERKAAVAAIPAYRAICAKERRKMTDPSAYLRGTFRNFAVRLTPRAPESEAVQALRRALGAQFTGGIMVELGSPQWAAWEAVAEEARLPLRAIGYPARPFAGRPEAVTGRYMPSEWPPSRYGPDRQQQAAGD